MRPSSRPFHNQLFILLLALLLSGCFLDGGGGSGGSGEPAVNNAQPTVNIAGASITESSDAAATLLFTVTLSGASSSDVTVAYATADGTALAASDYAATSGTLTISAGDTSGTVTVMVNADSVFESAETLTVTLSNPSGATLGTAVATGTINNDESMPTVSITAASVTESSDAAATLLFTVTLSGASSSDVTVAYATADGTALAASDYAATSGTLTISAGDTSGTVTVTVNADTDIEGDETLTVTLSSPSGATLGTAVATGTIVSDDLPTVSIADASVIEGASGATNLDFTVTLSASSSSDVAVGYATSDGTALAASDYTSANATLSIMAGDTSGTITVVLNGDTGFEPNETFTLTLSNPVNATISVASATGTLLNDDVGGYNDTGIITWGDGSVNNLTAAQATFPGQDADFGRDANGATNGNSDGIAGFSFTKLDSSGAALVDQAAVYGATPWDCVQDNVTGLMWEVKTPAAAGGLRDANYTYSWFNSTGVNDGGNAGTANGGSCVNGTDCDTEKYVAAVNAAGLCGYADWRLPRKEALRSIVVYGNGTLGLDSGYFPNYVWLSHWSSSPFAADASFAWATFFFFGNSDLRQKSTSFRVRLVRDGF